MAFNIKNDETDRLVRELTALTGESLTEAVTQALRERLARERRAADPDGVARLLRHAQRFGRLPVLDHRDPDAILGYDAHGLPA